MAREAAQEAVEVLSSSTAKRSKAFREELELLVAAQVARYKVLSGRPCTTATLKQNEVDYALALQQGADSFQVGSFTRITLPLLPNLFVCAFQEDTESCHARSCILVLAIVQGLPEQVHHACSRGLA